MKILVCPHLVCYNQKILSEKGKLYFIIYRKRAKSSRKKDTIDYSNLTSQEKNRNKSSYIKPSKNSITNPTNKNFQSPAYSLSILQEKDTYHSKIMSESNPHLDELRSRADIRFQIYYRYRSEFM